MHKNKRAPKKTFEAWRVILRLQRQSLSSFPRSRVHILQGLTDACVACALCVDASAGPAALAARLPHVDFDLGVEDGSRMVNGCGVCGTGSVRLGGAAVAAPGTQPSIA